MLYFIIFFLRFFLLAHGKRSYPQRDVKINDFDHWAALKFPEKVISIIYERKVYSIYDAFVLQGDIYQFKKLSRDNSIQQMRYPTNEMYVTELI